jgi:hypothetical protein
VYLHQYLPRDQLDKVSLSECRGFADAPAWNALLATDAKQRSSPEVVY